MKFVYAIEYSIVSLPAVFVSLSFLQSFVTAGLCPTEFLHGSSGNFKSPNYPKLYKSYTNCSWSITVPEGGRIKLTFLDFLLETDFGCAADVVRVYDGKDTLATLLGSYCGAMDPFNVHSTGNHLYVRFTSDRSLNTRGFRATYKGYNQATTVAASPIQTTITTPTVQTITFLKALRNTTTAKVGQEIRFQCHVTGATNIKIVWSKDRKPVDGQLIRTVPAMLGVKSVLKIKSATQADAGVYWCIASDDASNSIHSIGNLVITEIPTTVPTTQATETTGATSTTKESHSKPVITNPPKNWTLDYEEEVTLTCKATGSPPAYVSWFMDGKLVANNTSNFNIRVQEQVTRVQCVAQNIHGKDTRNAYIEAREQSAAAASQPRELNTSWGRGTLVVVILCMLLGLVLLALGVIVFVRSRNHVGHTKIPLPSNLEQLAQNPIFEKSSNDYGNPQLEKWELPRNNIEFINDLADGTFFRTFLGKISHPTRGDQGSLAMVKALKEDNPSSALKETFDADAFRWATLEHPNLQSFIGVCAVDRPLCLVFEYEGLSNLGSFLRDCGRSRYVPHPNFDPDDNKLELSNLDQIGIATQISAGMEYLSAQGHIHKELCVNNCVVAVYSMAVKISNLGFSWMAPSTGYYELSTAEQEKYPVRWLPPEAILEGTFCKETDVWSFGVTLWEIYSSGLKPYYGMGNEEVIKIVRDGDLLPCPKECPKEVYRVMCECWQLDSFDRPSFSTIHQQISTLYSGVAV